MVNALIDRKLRVTSPHSNMYHQSESTQSESVIQALMMARANPIHFSRPSNLKFLLVLECAHALLHSQTPNPPTESSEEQISEVYSTHSRSSATLIIPVTLAITSPALSL